MRQEARLWSPGLQGAVWEAGTLPQTSPGWFWAGGQQPIRAVVRVGGNGQRDLPEMEKEAPSGENKGELGKGT